MENPESDKQSGCAPPPGDAAGLFDLAISHFAEQPGDVIGPYTLLEVIGDGGFGRVWRADQSTPVHRQVALKIIKGGMDTGEILSRFRLERQALALMDHPGIARVFDAGSTPSGRPFFTMELVRGLPITAYCDDHSLGLSARLRLFSKVCLAVQHAHQKGIIHRDLKPSNILVCEEDGEAVPRVIDFGVAKAVAGVDATGDQSYATRLHQVIGTPGYMSPEQAGAGETGIDTRSDIYSLGVVLYEMLTGTLPFESEDLARAAMDAVLRKVREESPPQPSRRISSLAAERATGIARQRGLPPDRLPAALRGDLDWITLKCLEKDRQRRYESTGALAADIRNHLEHRPVAACPPRWSYLLGRALRRNRLAFLFGATTGLSLLAGSAIAIHSSLRERQARIAEQTERIRAEHARASAERARDDTEDILGWMLGDLNRKLRPLGKLELLGDVANTAANYYKNLPEQEHSPERGFKLAQALLLRGDVLFQRNDLPEAIGLYEEGLSIVEPLSAARPDNEDYLRWISVAVSRLGDACRCHGKFARAMDSRRRSLEISRALAARHPDNAQLARGLCIELRKFAESQYDTGDKSAARASIAECIGLSRQSSPGHLPFALAVLADWERQAQNFPEAANLYREAIGAFGKLCQEDPDNVKENRYLAQFQLMLAESLVPQGALGEARRQLAASRELHARLTVIDPSNTDLRGDRAQSLRVSGRINMQAGEDAAAADDFSQALEVYRELTAKDPSFVFWRQGMCDAGDSLDKLARLPTATRATRLANVAAQINLAEMWLAAGIAANAREYLDAATRLAEHLAAEPNPDPAIPGLLERCGALRGKAIGPPD